MTLFTDISLITLTVISTEKTAGVGSPNEYIQSGITSLPGGHDFNVVTQQSLSTGANNEYPNGFSILALAGHFIKGKPEITLDPSTGLSTNTLSYYINVLTPGCEVVTVDNAYSKYIEFKTKLAELSGLTELNNWVDYYLNENFTISHTALVDQTDFAIEWWMDHEINWPRINNAV